MEIAGIILYVLFVVYFTFVGDVVFNNVKVEIKLLKFIITVIGFPLMGLIFWCIGWLGDLILAPFQNIF